MGSTERRFLKRSVSVILSLMLFFSGVIGNPFCIEAALDDSDAVTSQFSVEMSDDGTKAEITLTAIPRGKDVNLTRIRLPDGTDVDGDQAVFVAETSGEYRFEMAYEETIRSEATPSDAVTVSGSVEAIYTLVLKGRAKAAMAPLQQWEVRFTDWNGAVLKRELVENGEAATAPVAPEREGFTFERWDKDFSKVESNLVIKALYSADTLYQITVNYIFKTSGGMAYVPHSELLAFGADYRIDSPQIEGYRLEDPNQQVISGVMDQLLEHQKTVDVYYVADLDTSYKVEYYQETPDGSGYALADTDNFDGFVGQNVTVPVKEYTGFELDMEKTQSLNLVVGENAQTVKQVFYNRKTVRIYFSTSGSYIPPIVGRFGQDVSQQAALVPVPVRSGYVFDSWDKEIPSQLTEDIWIQAVWNSDSAEYSVLHWKQKPVGDGYVLAETERRNGPILTEASYTAKTYTGFHFKEADQNPEIHPDGSTVLNVYYDRDIYGISFYIGSNLYHEVRGRYGAPVGEWPDGNQVLQEYNAQNPGSPMKTFLSWINKNYPGTGGTGLNYTSEIPTIPIPSPGDGDTFRLDAVFSNRNMTAYHILIYLQNTDGTYSEDAYKHVIANMESSTTIHFLVKDDVIGFSPHQYRTGILGFPYGGTWAPAYDKQDIVLKAPYNYTVELQYSRRRYNLNYISNGVQIKQDSILFQDKVPADYVPENGQTGYTFMGWYKDEFFYEKAGEDETMPAGDMILYAKWKPSVYEVVFDAAGGAPVETQQVNMGSKAEKPADPVRAGYQFIGWYLESGLPYIFDEEVHSNQKLTARWMPQSDILYRVIHCLADGTVFDQQEKTGVMGSTVYENALVPLDAQYPADTKIVADRNRKSLEIQADSSENIITFVYHDYASIPYKVRYIASGRTRSEDTLIDQQEFTTENVVMTERAKNFPGYVPHAYFQTMVMSFEDEYNVFTFYYAKNGDSFYQVEYYLENGNEYRLEETESFTALTGSKVTAEVKDFSGYTFDRLASERTMQGIVRADRETPLVLKLYYSKDRFSGGDSGEISGGSSGGGGSNSSTGKGQVTVPTDNKSEPSISPDPSTLVQDGQTPTSVVLMTDGSLPKTGDNTRQSFWLWAMALSAAGIVLSFQGGKRRRKTGKNQ